MALGKQGLEECVCQFSIGNTTTNPLSVKIPLSLPISLCPRELAHRIITLHNIPVYYYSELVENLQKIIREKNYGYYSTQDRKYISALKNGTVDIKAVAACWQSKFSQSFGGYIGKPHEQEELAGLYHSLVHSPTVRSLLSLEHSYSDAVSSLVSQKEAKLHELQKKQAIEMQQAVEAVGSHLTDDDVNSLAARQLEDSQMLEVQWDSTISASKEEQKREFRNFIAESFEGRELSTPITPKEFLGNNSTNSDIVIVENVGPVQEESFTIHLGTQMKQMHNLRLLSADVMDLFRYQQLDDSAIPPQRIQTAMSLYSHNLNGMVLLVDDRINTYSGFKKDFGRVCSRSTELHFPDVEDQLEHIRDLVPEVVQWRRDHPPPQYECDDDSQTTPPVPQHLKSGDFYITHHSNLADVHVVFHMVVDDTLRSPDINSRHSVILGLRNVLKVACLGDITTLTVPLFLTHTLTEEMTISWCQKRAELVYKCIKGFMIEMASWGGAEMKNLQFLIPKGVSDDLFQSLASMLQSIFRLSNPLVVKTSRQESAAVS